MEDAVLAAGTDGTIMYKRLTSKYLDNVCSVVQKTIFTDGNVSRRSGINQDPEALKELDQLSIMSCQDGVSIIAIDRNTDKVVGVAINKLLTKTQPFYEGLLETFKNAKARNVIKYIFTTDNIIDLFEHFKVNCLMEILFLGTLPEYRKKGIAKKLSELSVETAQNLYDGINVKLSPDGKILNLEPVPEAVSAIFTSFISQKIGQNLGFEIVAERSNRRIELNGQIFDNSDAETSTAQLQVKLLQKKNVEEI